MNTHVRRADRISGMGISSILRLAQIARDLRCRGKPVADLSAGQPDFETPDHICEAAISAMKRGEIRSPSRIAGPTPAES